MASLSFATDSDSDADCVGFTFGDDGVRRETYYGSAEERAWCECSELLDRGLLAEAQARLPLLSDRNMIRKVMSAVNKAAAAADTSGTPAQRFRRKAKLECDDAVAAHFNDNLDGWNASLDALHELLEAREKEIFPLVDYNGPLHGRFTVFSETRSWKDINASGRTFTTSDDVEVTQNGGQTRGFLYLKDDVLPPWYGGGHAKIHVRCADEVVFDDKTDLVISGGDTGGDIVLPAADIARVENGGVTKPRMVCDMEAATTNALKEDAENWMLVSKLFDDCGLLNKETDQHLDKLQQIFSLCVERGELDLACSLGTALLKLDARMVPYCGPGWFMAMLAECHETKGRIKSAHHWYTRIHRWNSSSDGDVYDPDPENFTSVSCEAVPEGTLDKRLARTAVPDV